MTGYRIMVRHLAGMIGNVKLAELKVRDVDFALGQLAKRLSTRSVRLARMILIQATRNAMVNDLVVRNAADLTAAPTGKPGRPSRSLNLDQALAVLDAAVRFRRSHRADRGRGGPLQQPDHRGRVPAPAPAGDAYAAIALGPLFESNGGQS